MDRRLTGASRRDFPPTEASDGAFESSTRSVWRSAPTKEMGDAGAAARTTRFEGHLERRCMPYVPDASSVLQEFERARKSTTNPANLSEPEVWHGARGVLPACPGEAEVRMVRLHGPEQPGVRRKASRVDHSDRPLVHVVVRVLAVRSTHRPMLALFDWSSLWFPWLCSVILGVPGLGTSLGSAESAVRAYGR